MAEYRLSTSSISRGAGRSAVAAAAYRAGERLRDERTGALHNHARRIDVRYKEILLPAGCAAACRHWAGERAQLWNLAERAELRRNARVAREYQLNLYPELDESQRVQLARRFARELAERHGVAVDLAIHDPRPGGDPRNFHAHLLVTSRRLTAAGFGSKAGLDMSSADRRRLQLLPGIAEIKALRARWAALSNEAMAAAGLSIRVDHRTLRAQGIDREPLPHLPSVIWRMERRGLRTRVGERIREGYRMRLQARLAARPPSVNLEEVRREAREAWQRLRSLGAPAGSTLGDGSYIKESSPAQAAAPARSADAERQSGLDRLGPDVSL